jgi:hypothetical protein
MGLNQRIPLLAHGANSSLHDASESQGRGGGIRCEGLPRQLVTPGTPPDLHGAVGPQQHR